MSVRSMRSLINLCESKTRRCNECDKCDECDKKLEEGECAFCDLEESGAGPNRIAQHIRNGSMFITISAMRANLKRSVNLRRTKELKNILDRYPGISSIEIEGEYQEEGSDKPSPENSFFIMPRDQHTHVSPEAFRQFGIRLMQVFDQDSICYGDGKLVSLICSDESIIDLGNTTTFRTEVIADLGGFSKIKGRKFGFTDQPTAERPVVNKADNSEVPTKTKGIRYGGYTPETPNQKVA